MITYLQIKQIYPTAKNSNINAVLPFLNSAMQRYGISNSLDRTRAFISQILHESGGFKYMEEIASGSAYEGRKDLGNINPGDGKLFKGRGPLQVTGRANYAKLTKRLNINGINFEKTPNLLSNPKWGVEAACLWWSDNHLNEMSDNLSGNIVADNGVFKMITKTINGGYNGLDDRLRLYSLALKYII